jgi:hypothetical protein
VLVLMTLAQCFGMHDLQCGQEHMGNMVVVKIIVAT